MISLKIIDSTPSVTKKVNRAFADQLNKRLKNKVPNIQNESKSLIDEWILSQPEIISLLSRNPLSLAGQFGIPSSMVPTAVSSIIQSVKNSTYTHFEPFNQDLKGNLSIHVQQSDFSNILSLVEGHVFYENGDLHWLNWLITLGSSMIIANYSYQASGGNGRSGLGVMKIGGSFRVPPAFSGTIEDNFITRAISGISQQNQIFGIIKKALI